MNHVRNEIGHQLIDALNQCNLADINEGDGERANDINPKCSRQHEAYGYISDALTSLGFNRAREIYVIDGDTDAAHAAIDRNQPKRQKKTALKSRLEEMNNAFEAGRIVGGAA